jgi:hypothetical protein
MKGNEEEMTQYEMKAMLVAIYNVVKKANDIEEALQVIREIANAGEIVIKEE